MLTRADAHYNPPLSSRMPDPFAAASRFPLVDHRGPDLPAVVTEAVAGLRHIFGTARGAIVLYPGSGTGAWEASLVNTLSPGDAVLTFVNGHFSALYTSAPGGSG
jgi:alanine-glyoxylate transaminase/serine-glyoxylate transaminase/serine-pyruvate transaminase